MSTTISVPIGNMHNPRRRVLALALLAQGICEEIGEGPAEGAVMLLTAAAHIALTHSGRSRVETEAILAEVLADACIAAEGFFHADTATVQ